MGIDQIKEPLTEFIKRVSEQVRVHDVIIFGSYHKGTANPESDIDVLVVSNDFANIDMNKRLKILDTAARNIEPEIVAGGFTEAEMEKFTTRSILGNARETGIHFLQQ